MSFTLRQLRAFAAVVEAGSFAGAALRLHLTPSALSVLVRELESGLGVKVFDRHTRRVQLTEAGLHLLPHAERVLADVAAAAASVGELREKRRGQLRLAAPQTLAATLVARAIVVYRQRHPGIQLTLEDTPTDRLVERVLGGAVEMAVGVDVPSPAEVARRRLFRSRHWLALPADHALAARRQVPWSALRQHAWIAPTPDFMKWLAPVLAPRALRLEPAHTSGYVSTALGLAAAGFGPTAVPSYGAPLARNWGLVLRPLVAPVFERDVQVYTRPGRSLSPAAAAFVELLVELVAETGLGAAVAAP